MPDSIVTLLMGLLGIGVVVAALSVHLATPEAALCVNDVSASHPDDLD